MRHRGVLPWGIHPLASLRCYYDAPGLQIFILRQIYLPLLTAVSSRLGGVVVIVLATGPKGRGFKTLPIRWIFQGDKNPQHTFLRMGSKVEVPMS
jgi:hypothetical protein